VVWHLVLVNLVTVVVNMDGVEKVVHTVVKMKDANLNLVIAGKSFK
jgi:hypothetical protein